MRKTPEADLQRAVTDLLTARRIWWMRINTGMWVLEYHGKKRVFRAGRPGMADLLAIAMVPWCATCRDAPKRTPNSDKCANCLRYPSRIHRPAWIECKAPRGVQSAAQKAFEQEVMSEGHSYAVIRSIPQLKDFLHGLGLP